MNVAGHVTVAAGLTPGRSDIWLGAALPDLAAMGRFRLLGASDHDGVTSGISLHHRTDDAFHRSPWFRHHQSRVQTTLAANDGLSRGAVRAIAHVGPELLLDGHLLGHRRVRIAVDASLEQIDPLTADLRPLVTTDRDEWTKHLVKVAGWGLPADYDRPTAVAARLQRILSRRSRLAFDSSETNAVAGSLADVHDSIVQSADELIDLLISELR